MEKKPTNKKPVASDTTRKIRYERFTSTADEITVHDSGGNKIPLKPSSADTEPATPPNK